jgi:hypothetical protein
MERGLSIWTPPGSVPGPRPRHLGIKSIERIGDLLVAGLFTDNRLGVPNIIFRSACDVIYLATCLLLDDRAPTCC